MAHCVERLASAWYYWFVVSLATNVTGGMVRDLVGSQAGANVRRMTI